MVHGKRSTFVNQHCRCRECRAADAAYKRIWYGRTARASELRHRRQRENRWKKLGLTTTQVEELLEQQGGLCAICRTASSRYLGVDHNHTTGKPRGILCQNCNTAIAFLDEDPARLIAAARYLESYE